MTGIAQYWTHEALGQASWDIERLRQELSEFHAHSVLAHASTAAIVLSFWARRYRKGPEYVSLVKSFFDPTIAAVIVQGRESRFLFSRRQLLVLQRLAIETSRREGGMTPSDPRSALKFGHILLGINDILHFGLAGTGRTSAEWIRNLFTEIIPVVEDAGSSVLSRAGRSMSLLSEIPNLLRDDPGFIDLDAQFQQIAGVSLEVFRAICTGLISNWIQDLDVLLQNPARLVLHRGWFANVGIDGPIIDSYLALLSATVDEFRADFAGRKQIEDLTPFKSRPLCRVAHDRYLVTDLILLAETLESHPFWKLSPKVTNLREFWGKCFERYACEMTRSIASPHVNRLLCQPRISNTDGEFCDLAVTYGRTLVMIEAKGVMFSADVKYSGQPGRVFKVFEERFVRNPKGEPKGIGQLGSSIRKVFVDGAKVEGIETSNIVEVFPLVVTLDQIGDNILFSRALNLYFSADALTRESGIRISPALGMSVEAFEFMTAHLDEVPLAVLVKDWLSADSTLMTPYMVARTTITDLLGDRKNSYVVERYKKLMTESVSRLFPNAQQI